MDRTLTLFIRVWLILAALINVLAIAGLFVGAPTVASGWTQIQDIYSPFNLINYVLEVILLSPALAAYWWRETRRKKPTRAKTPV